MNRKRIRNELDLLFISIGIFLGIELAKLVDFQMFKVLNIIGLTFDIFGVLILTYTIASSEKIKTFICTWGATFSISFIAFTPLGVLIGIMFASYLLGIENNINPFSQYVPISVYCMLSVFLFEDLVQDVKLKYFDNLNKRIKFLGGYFLFSGLGMQLIASFLDLLEK